MTQDYMLNRDNFESNRLLRQHELWSKSLGYLLHPTVLKTLPQSNVRIADIGTGTAVWLYDLQARTRDSSASWQFDGFDISDAQFPPKDQLPPNMSLRIANVKEPFPEELRGTYDFIHVRLLILALAGDEWGLAVENLMGLLKPGGWLQWEDIDIAPMLSILRNKGECATENLHNGFTHLVHTVRHRCYDIPGKLDKAFAAAELQNVQRDVISSDRFSELRETITTTQIGVMVGVCKQQVANGVKDAWSLEKIDTVAKAMEVEAKQGAYINYYINCIIGQKGG